jgi:1,5-anhydro-D-fructose reductase (1,5-anhydro-D-mannitol-forming)
VETGWAVVGLGAHAVGRTLPALRRSRNARLVGVYSRNPETTREVAARYGARAYAAFGEAMADPAVRVVYLATPNDLHAAQTVECAAAGKHVLVEKPMALSEEDAARMVQACDRAGVRLYVGFHLRFHPAHQHVRSLVTSGAIGDVVWAGAQWASQRPADAGWRLDPARSGGTLLTARGVHLLDLIRFVCGAEFLTISGCSDGFRGAKAPDDITQAMGELTSGGFAHILCSRLVPGASNHLVIYGSRGTIFCRDTIAAEPTGTLTLVQGGKATTSSYDACDALRAQCEWVSAAVAGDRIDPIGARGEDGARVTAATVGLVASVRSGRTVTLDDVT